MAGTDSIGNFAVMVYDFSTYKSVQMVLSSFEGAADNSDRWERHLGFLGRLSKECDSVVSEEPCNVLHLRLQLARLCVRLLSALNEELPQDQRETMWLDALKYMEDMAKSKSVKRDSELFVLIAKLNRYIHAQYFWHLVECTLYKKAQDAVDGYQDMLPDSEQSATLAILQKMLQKRPGSEVWTRQHGRLATKLTYDTFVENVVPLLQQLNDYHGVPYLARSLQEAVTTLAVDCDVHPKRASRRDIDFVLCGEASTDEDHDRHETVGSDDEGRIGHSHSLQRLPSRNWRHTIPSRCRGDRRYAARNHSEPLMTNEGHVSCSMDDKEDGESSAAGSDQSPLPSCRSRSKTAKRSILSFVESNGDETTDNQQALQSENHATEDISRTSHRWSSVRPLRQRLFSRLSKNGIVQTWSSDEESEEDRKKRIVIRRRHTAHAARHRRFKWTAKEVAALKDGVAVFGEGNWVGIYNEKKDALKGRRPVDLKDKWRNMKRNDEV